MDTSKIIKGVVNSGRYTVTAPIVKEDYGLYLQIEGVELPQTYEVDFSNSEHNGTSVTMIGNADGVLIPSQFISSGKDVFAFLYHVGVDFGRTIYKFRIPNKLRPDRTDEEPTPEEQSTIDQAITALNTAVVQTAQDVIDADASAQSASADAERAEEARTDAQNYANNAQASATSASQSATASANSATASAQSASQSAQIKADVEDMVDDAQASADASAQSASASANSATTAQGYATSASQSATSAQGYASQAQTSAQTASNKAQDASTSAQTASQKATEASQSASQALTYKTDAESAKTASQTAQGLAESARDTAVQAKTDAESARDEAQNLVDGISGKVEQIDSNTERIESLEDDRYKPYVVDSASGSIASFPDGADDIPLKSLVVDIDPVQDTSSGDPSPENICPISGWEGMNLKDTGKNLLGGEFLLSNAQRYIPGGTTNEEEEYFQFTAGAATDNFYRFSTGVPFKENTQYTFILTLYKTSGTGSNMRIYYKDGSYSVIPNLSSAEHKETIVYTSASNKTILTVTKSNMSGSTRLYYNESGVFEGVLTVLDFEPYQGQTIPINWQTEAGTVYGGKLDVLSGVLRVEWASKTTTFSEGWGTVIGTYKRVSIAINPIADVDRRHLTLCNLSGTYKNAFSEDSDHFYITTSGGTGYCFVPVGTSGELQFVYPLAEPIEIQLDAHTLSSLLGQNNIWADTGDTMAEYRADTKLYIEKLTQPEEDDMIADSAISEGQFFMVGNTLYRALANIASGATITVGTNAQRVSLSDALNLVNT